MAQQKSVIKLQGSIDGITYYEKNGKYFARKKPNGNNLNAKTGPHALRISENKMEFTTAAKAVKLFRRTFIEQLIHTKGTNLNGRAMKLMMKVVKADNTSARGSRKVLPVNLTPLQGFEFNPYGEIGKNVKMEITATYDRATGTVKLNIPSNVPQDKVNAPEGATHFKYALAAAEIDFDQSTSRVLSANSDQIVWGPQTEAGLSLSVGLNPNSTLPVFIGLSLEFSQTVNGTFYPLKNSASNGCSIILVSIA